VQQPRPFVGNIGHRKATVEPDAWWPKLGQWNNTTVATTPLVTYSSSATTSSAYSGTRLVEMTKG
jgi:hypothetical protein